MALRINRYWVGTHNSTTLPIKRVIGANRRVIKRSRRHNKTYAGKRTRREERILTIKIRLLIAVFVITGIYGWIQSTQYHTFAIQSTSGQVVEAKAEAATQAGQITEGEEQKTSPKESVAVLNETPEQGIRRIAKEMNFKYPDYLVRLAFHESSLNPKAINKNKNGSIDRGIFQWNDKTAPMGGISDDCAFSVDCSARATIKAIEAGYQKRWMANKEALKKD